jgi:hypothetical protein
MLEGSLEPETLMALAQRNERPPAAALRRNYAFDSRQSFLDLTISADCAVDGRRFL